jgi:hypothetical protein
MSKKKWEIYTVVTGGTYAGTVEADTKDEAEELASLCHQCSSEVGDIEAESLIVEEVKS